VERDGRNMQFNPSTRHHLVTARLSPKGAQNAWVQQTSISCLCSPLSLTHSLFLSFPLGFLFTSRLPPSDLHIGVSRTPSLRSILMSSTTKDSPVVLISGAGLSGLLLGQLLERAGIEYHIFERATKARALGKDGSSFISVRGPTTLGQPLILVLL